MNSVSNSFYSLVLGEYFFPCACSNRTPEKEIKRNELAHALFAITGYVNFLLFSFILLLKFECSTPTDRGVFLVMFIVQLDWVDNIEKNGKTLVLISFIFQK